MDAKARQLAGLIRRCLSARHILRSRNQELFGLLVQSRLELSGHFKKMGAELVINESLGIAYLSALAEWDEEIPYRLGRNRVLGAWETLALIFLRHKRMEFFSGTIDSETPRISRQEVRDYLKEFSAETEDKRFENQFTAVLKNLREHQILLTQDEITFEVTPVCDVLLPADQINTLRERAKTYFSETHEIDSSTLRQETRP